MHMKERATYRCRSKRCGTLPPVRSAFGEDDDVRSSHDTDRSRSRASSQRRPSALSRKPHHSTRRRPKTNRRDDACLDFMSHTLVSVAAKLEKAFNSSGAPNQKVKRVYVIKFDDNNTNLKSSCKKRILYTRKGENSRKMKRAPSKHSHRARCPDTALDEKATISLSSSDGRRGDAPDSSPDHSFADDDQEEKNTGIEFIKHRILWNNAKSELDNSGEFPSVTHCLQSKIDTPPDCMVISQKCAREKANTRHAHKSQKTEQIADIFGAILKEIESLSPAKEGRATSPKKKTLSEVIESDQSLVSADYTIPRSMVNKEAVDVLQALIDYKRKPQKKTHGRRSWSSQRLGSVTGPIGSMEWYGLHQPLNYQAEVFREPEINLAASSSGSGPICRICHERLGTLVRPCRCRGSMAYVHVECLQMWLTEKEIDYCELCNYKFKVIHVPEYRLLPSIGFWYKFAATNEQRKKILIDLTLAVLLLPVLIFITYFARSSSTEYPSEDDYENDEYEDSWTALGWMLLVYGLRFLTFLLNMSYIGAVFMRINHHLSTWLSWYVNKNVTVVLEDRHPGSRSAMLIQTEPRQ